MDVKLAGRRGSDLIKKKIFIFLKQNKWVWLEVPIMDLEIYTLNLLKIQRAPFTGV